jgi:hypothetical protein
MNHDATLHQFDRLNVWIRGGERAPHKPLLVLYVFGRWSRSESADIPFADVDRDLTPLLREFGLSRRSYHPEFPFWHLNNDGVCGKCVPAGIGHVAYTQRWPLSGRKCVQESRPPHRTLAILWSGHGPIISPGNPKDWGASLSSQG